MNDTPAALDGVRVLDFTGAAGQYATKLLADLGADVVRVEPPVGSPARNRPPFADDDPSPNRSIAFWYWNTSKRSVTLDISTDDGRALLHRLLPRFDVLVHTFQSADAAALGLTRDTLAAVHPGLITCSITPYGDWGPHAGYLGGDLVVEAMSGMVWLAGYPDRAPIQPPGEQAAVCGGIQAAQGILLALLMRDTTGRGQHVEVSQQEAMGLTQETAMQFWDMRRELRKRQGETKLLPGIGTYECADGYIYSMVGVPGFGAPTPVLVEWMETEGMAGDLNSDEWRDFFASFSLRSITQMMTQPEAMAEMMVRLNHVDGLIQAFYRTKAKQELYIEGQSRRLLIGPVNSAKDLTEDRQLVTRGWWQEVEHDELGRTISYPGAPYHHSATPWRIHRRPPLLGEHTLSVLETELGLTRAQTEILMGAQVI